MMRPDPPQPPADGGFNGPRGVAVDAAGNTFVVDTYNQRVEKLAPDGSFITGVGPTGPGRLLVQLPAHDRDRPHGPVGCPRRHRQQPGQEVHQRRRLPLGVRQHRHRARAVQEPARHRRRRRRPHLRRRHQQRAGPGAWPRTARRCTRSGPAAPRPDSSSCHAGSSSTTRPGTSSWPTRPVTVVQEFTNGGTYLRTFGGPGTTPDKLRQAFDVEVDADNLYVSDTIDNSIKVFAKSDGTLRRAASAVAGPCSASSATRRAWSSPTATSTSPSGTTTGSRTSGSSTDVVAPTVTIDTPGGTVRRRQSGSPAPRPTTGPSAGRGADREPEHRQWWQTNGTWGAAPVDFTAKLASPGAPAPAGPTRGPARPGPTSSTRKQPTPAGTPRSRQRSPSPRWSTPPSRTPPSPPGEQRRAARPTGGDHRYRDGRPGGRAGAGLDQGPQHQPLVGRRPWRLDGPTKWNEATVYSPGATASGWIYSFDDSASPGLGPVLRPGPGRSTQSGKTESTRPAGQVLDLSEPVCEPWTVRPARFGTRLDRVRLFTTLRASTSGLRTQGDGMEA